MFNPDEAKYAKGVVVTLPYPTDDVRLLTRAAVDAVAHVFQPGFRYSKAEVMLLDLRQPGEFSDDLFAVNQPAEASRVMAVLDHQWPLGQGHTAGSQRAGQAGLGYAPGNDEPELYDTGGSALASVEPLTMRLTR